MINWSLLTPRNIFVIAALALIAAFVFHFFTKDGN